MKPKGIPEQALGQMELTGREVQFWIVMAVISFRDFISSSKKITHSTYHTNSLPCRFSQCFSTCDPQVSLI
jgi:hypothetical protein